MLKHWMMLAAVFAALAVGSATASAMPRLNPVAIERALNGQSITIRFSDTSARLIEFRVNGQSVATRSVNGELEDSATFRLDTTMLSEGRNEIEARIFDADGKLLGSESSSMDIAVPMDSPVEVVLPKAGSTVMGLVEIRVQLKDRFERAFVSFLVNGQWKAVRNYEPFTYILDTETLPNGWHEIQVMAVDENNTTFRSRRVRIFVNNPGGRTERVVTPPSTPVPAPMPSVAPLATASAQVVARPSRPASARSMRLPAVAPVATGVRDLTPTGRRNIVRPASSTAVSRPSQAAPARPVQVAPARPTQATLPRTVAVAPAARPASAPVAPRTAQVTQASSAVRITRGTRLNISGPLTLTYGARIVNFDVQPRVEQGIPLTPFRHLYEAAGGRVDWRGEAKVVEAKGASDAIRIQIGSRFAQVGSLKLELERPAFIQRGRTVVPLSFISESLRVHVEVDARTGHVLITEAQ